MHTWTDQFRTHDEACEYYGCDTPSQVAAQEEWERQDERVEDQDAMEAHGGPLGAGMARLAEREAWQMRNRDVVVPLDPIMVVDCVFPGYWAAAVAAQYVADPRVASDPPPPTTGFPSDALLPAPAELC